MWEENVLACKISLVIITYGKKSNRRNFCQWSQDIAWEILFGLCEFFTDDMDMWKYLCRGNIYVIDIPVDDPSTWPKRYFLVCTCLSLSPCRASQSFWGPTRWPDSETVRGDHIDRQSRMISFTIVGNDDSQEQSTIIIWTDSRRWSFLQTVECEHADQESSEKWLKARNDCFQPSK